MVDAIALHSAIMNISRMQSNGTELTKILFEAETVKEEKHSLHKYENELTVRIC